MASKQKKYQFGVGRRIIHIKAASWDVAKKKAMAWHKKHAPNATLSYDYIVD